MKNLILFTLLPLCGLVAVASANPYKAENPLVSGDSWWSLNATNFTDQAWKVAADFKCTNSAADINSAEWWMASRYGATLSDIDSFEINFYEDTGSGPGNLLHTANVTGYNADFISEISWGSGPNGQLYKFSGDISPMFDQTAGNHYWFSVMANVPYTAEDGTGADNGQWRWIEGEAFGQWHYADRPDDEPTGWLTYADYSSDYEFDMAFNLVPEPATLAFLSFGLVFVCKRRRA